MVLSGAWYGSTAFMGCQEQENFTKVSQEAFFVSGDLGRGIHVLAGLNRGATGEREIERNGAA
jgi:hypothetical protein